MAARLKSHGHSYPFTNFRLPHVPFQALFVRLWVFLSVEGAVPRTDTGRLQEPQAALAARVREALHRAGLTQSEAARLADVPRDIVHKATGRGSLPRNRSHREAIATALKVAPAWLWFGTGGAQATADHVSIDRHAALTSDPNNRAVEVGHDAFWPIARAGDLLYIARASSPEKGDRVYVRWSADIATFQGGAPSPYTDGLSEGIFRLNELGPMWVSLTSIHGLLLQLRADQIVEQAVVAGVVWLR
jgi:hypothetical protein